MNSRDDGEIQSQVTHLECSATGKRYEAGVLQNTSEAGKPLLVRYDLDAMARSIDKETLARRPPTLWRYHEWLPIRRTNDIVSLGEEITPLVPMSRMSEDLAGGDVWVKDEGRMPTGSFKARGMAVAVSMAHSFGVRQVALPTAGSGGASLAAYCRRAGMEAYIFCPDDAPEVTIREIGYYGPKFYLVNGFVEDCNRMVAAGCEEMGWFDMSTLKEPYRIEGKKTMGLELAEQMDWELPDLIFYPTGGGTGFIGMWKAFAELKAMGWLQGKLPRMVAVQTTGCCPIVKAFEQGLPKVEVPWPEMNTQVHGVRVAKPLGDFLILRVIQESGGLASAVSDAEVEETRAEVARREGLQLCPEGAACFAAYRKERQSDRVKKEERAVIFNTATGLRTAMPPVDNRVDRENLPDFSKL